MQNYDLCLCCGGLFTLVSLGMLEAAITELEALEMLEVA